MADQTEPYADLGRVRRLLRRIAAHHERTMRIFERWVRDNYRW